MELFIEEENTGLSEEMTRAKFTDLVNYLNKTCFDQEKQELLALSDKNSNEYLIKYSQLAEKAKKLGIKFNRG